MLLARRDAGLARAVAPAQLRELTLIGQKASSCQLLVDQGLRSQGVDPDYVFRSNDNGAVQAMVRAGMGVAVLPWLAIDPDDPEIRVHPLDPPIPPRSIGLIRRADRTLSPGAEAFRRPRRRRLRPRARRRPADPHRVAPGRGTLAASPSPSPCCPRRSTRARPPCPAGRRCS